jgi:hypothetical protein
VDENATAIDARLPAGELTLVKLGPTFDTLSVVEGELTGYAGFPGSDCLNGAVIEVPDGHALMDRLPSHHSVLLAGSTVRGRVGHRNELAAAPHAGAMLTVPTMSGRPPSPQCGQQSDGPFGLATRPRHLGQVDEPARSSTI